MGGSPLPMYDDGDGDRMAWGCKLDWFWNTVSYCSSTYEVSTEFCVFASKNYNHKKGILLTKKHNIC